MANNRGFGSFGSFGSQTVLEDNGDSWKSTKESGGEQSQRGHTLVDNNCVITGSDGFSWEPEENHVQYKTNTYTNPAPTRASSREKTPTQTRAQTKTSTQTRAQTKTPTKTRGQTWARPLTSQLLESRYDAGASGAIPQTRAVSVRTVLHEAKAKYDEVQYAEYRDYVLSVVRNQCPELRKYMNNRFQNDSFKDALKEVDFNKVQKTFSEVYRVRKLVSLGESVCVVYVGDLRQGSGFALIGNLILTNAHLLSGALSPDGTTLTLPVKALFNYENPLESDSRLMFDVCEVLDLDWNVDYAVLCLNNSGTKLLPPGLMLNFGPKPNDGAACIIGHPGGHVKKIDLTFIVGMDDRQETERRNLEPLEDSERMVVVKRAEEQGLRNICTSDRVISYNTKNMYHGSSGSPLFDGECRVVGLHTRGFVYDFQGEKRSIIEFAHSVMDIVTSFVLNLGSSGRMDDLKTIVRLSDGNPHLREIFRHYGLV